MEIPKQTNNPVSGATFSTVGKAKNEIATFSRDMTKNFGEFVRITEVHQIVEDVYLPLLEAVQVREEEMS